MMRHGVVLVIVAVGVAFGARLAYAINTVLSAGTGSVTILIGGITGPCGYLSGATGGEGVYGHDISGTCCPMLSDAKPSTNYLTATLTESAPGNYVVLAQSTLSSAAYTNGASHAAQTCPQSGPSFHYSGSSVISLSQPAQGPAGSGNNSGTDAATLGGSNYGGSGSPPPQSGGQVTIPWHVDPQDAGTQTMVVSAKVQVSYNGTAADCKCANDKHSAKCKLVVSAS